MIGTTQISPNLVNLVKGVLKDPAYFDQSAPTPPKITEASAVSFKGRIDTGAGRGPLQGVWIVSFICVDVPTTDEPSNLESYLRSGYIASFAGGKLSSLNSEVHVAGDYASTWILAVDWMIGV